MTDYHGDNEFHTKTLETSLLLDLLHIHKNNEHVGIIQQQICTIKEHAREKFHSVTSKIYTSILKRLLIEAVVDFLKRFPSTDRVPDT